jgi:hypothetical protein
MLALAMVERALDAGMPAGWVPPTRRTAGQQVPARPAATPGGVQAISAGVADRAADQQPAAEPVRGGTGIGRRRHRPRCALNGPGRVKRVVRGAQSFVGCCTSLLYIPASPATTNRRSCPPGFSPPAGVPARSCTSAGDQRERYRPRPHPPFLPAAASLRVGEGVDHRDPGGLERCRVPSGYRESRRPGDASDQCVEVTDATPRMRARARRAA